MAIDQTAALKSASWGLGQILGENHQQVGYETVQEMVTAFMADEENHLEAIVAFLKTNNLDDDLREHRWEALAGATTARHTGCMPITRRLAEAYRKWARIADTPWKPGSSPAGPRCPRSRKANGRKTI